MDLCLNLVSECQNFEPQEVGGGVSCIGFLTVKMQYFVKSIIKNTGEYFAPQPILHIYEQQYSYQADTISQ
jgi:hypothetical protein